MSARRLLRAPAGALALFAAACTAQPAPEPPAHERETALAWAAYARGTPADLEAAIRHADACVKQYQGTATRKQAELAAKKEQPAVGVVSEAVKWAVLKHGPINDVGACLYIKLRAAAKLGRAADSAAAGAAVEQLPAARCWDPKGWLWSPADAAALFKRRPDLADKAPHEWYTAEAWAAVKTRDFATAAKFAARCTDEFFPSALAMDEALGKAGNDPATGEVSDATKKAIFANAVLNDVASCAFIRGEAFEELKDTAAAIRAYRDARRLPRGRCWDPNGWFWSPAEAAGDRLVALGVRP